MTKVQGKRYAYKFDFHGLMVASQNPQQDPTVNMLGNYSAKHHSHAMAHVQTHTGMHTLPTPIGGHHHGLQSELSSSSASSLEFPSPTTASLSSPLSNVLGPATTPPSYYISSPHTQPPLQHASTPTTSTATSSQMPPVTPTISGPITTVNTTATTTTPTELTRPTYWSQHPPPNTYN